MFVVAITRLAASVDAEAPELGKDLGVTAYEARLALAPGLPALVLRTTDEAQARALAAKLRARKHAAFAVDAATLVPHDRMVPMRQFALEPGRVVLHDRPEELPYDGILALLRAMHRSRTETEIEKNEKKLSVGRALMSGGILLTKNVKTEERTVSHEAQQVLYVFRRDGDVPWLLRERSANYTALGKDLAPSSAQNFTTLLRILRERAPDAVFDDRLMHRSAGERIARTGSLGSETRTASSADGVDLLAHVLALAAETREL